jgi:hypothetical protein
MSTPHTAGKTTNRRVPTCQNYLAQLSFLILHRTMAETLKATLALERLGPNTFKAEPFFERARSGNPHAIA